MAHRSREEYQKIHEVDIITECSARSFMRIACASRERAISFVTASRDVSYLFNLRRL